MTEALQTLAELGWSPYFQSQLDLEELETCRPVRVLAVHRGMVEAAGEDGLERVLTASRDLNPTAGDWLLLSREDSRPARVLERRSVFKRRAAGPGREIQLIAANIDTLFVVSSCNQDFNIARLERYLALAREAEVHPVVVLTKADECSDSDDYRHRAEAILPDLMVEVVDARDTASVQCLSLWCANGQTVALLGSSGVGKSTLTNTLTGETAIRTHAARADDDRGRHTTTGRALHRLAAGGWLLDTPGMRELQLIDVADGIDAVFEDIVALAHDCRFNDCSHEAEPGCAVQAAISDGALTPDRLKRYRKLASEERMNRESIAERRARQRSFGKRVAKAMRDKRDRTGF
ncbi:MAG: ribosome small subunit-dependent GTPase A [Pseudomonadota bacterium]